MKTRTVMLAWVTVGLMVGAGAAEEPPKEIQNYFNRLTTEHRNSLSGTQNQIAEFTRIFRYVKSAKINAAKGGSRSNPTTHRDIPYYSSAAEKTAALKNIEDLRAKAIAKLEKLKSAEPPWKYGTHASLDDPASVGDIGAISHVKIIQIVDDNNLIASHGNETVWITGVNTSNLTDSDSIETNYLMEATGTKRYTNAIGASRTVLHLEVFDESKLDEFTDDYSPPAKQAKKR